MAPQRGSVTSSDGVEIGFVSDGVGPPLLLVHGGMSSATRWAPLWPLLTQNHRVTAMDRRGRGMSGDAVDYAITREYDDIVAVAEHLADRATGGIDVFAHSIGATCTLGAAARGAPLRRLALYEPPGPETVSRRWVDRATTWMAEGQAGRAVGSFLVDIIGLDPALVGSLRDSPAAAESVRIATVSLVREAEALLALHLAELAAPVTAPVLFLLGDLSPGWAGTITRQMTRTLPHSAVTALPGQGHEALDTAPDVVVAQLHRFFAPA